MITADQWVPTEFMRENIKNLLLSELHAASGYLDRIFHTLFKTSALHNHRTAIQIVKEFRFDITGLFESSLINENLINQQERSTSTKAIREDLANSISLLTAMLKLDFNEKATTKLVVNFINLLYQYGYDFHLFAHEMTKLEIQLPRVNLLEISKGKEDDGVIPQFSLAIERVIEAEKSGSLVINSLEWQRDKRYDSLIQDGHEAVFNKEYDKALEKFSKASNFKETAEAITLTAWVYSLLKRNDKAKSLCLKAIRKDPDYGPPYNDLGTYLLSEGQTNEALKWFELAKNASNYQNREYPYINAGRAYMATNDFQKALDEFSKALTLAPYHEELHQTVQNLKSSLEKSSEKMNDMTAPFKKNDNSPKLV